MKKAVLIIIAFISISSCKNDSVWTKSYESKLYREINAEVSERLPDDSKRQKFVTFIIKRLRGTTQRRRIRIKGQPSAFKLKNR